MHVNIVVDMKDLKYLLWGTHKYSGTLVESGVVKVEGVDFIGDPQDFKFSKMELSSTLFSFPSLKGVLVFLEDIMEIVLPDVNGMVKEPVCKKKNGCF